MAASAGVVSEASSGATGASPAHQPPRRAGGSLWRGREADPAFVRPALVVLLIATGVLYAWGLGASGNANSFYAAAVQAGTKSWKAFFFGSFDASNFITVDKPPASLWVMELSGRIFGFSSWSMLLPQAAEGVAAVGILYLAVRRWSGAVAGLLAALVFATTPVAALMFRFNNPDALLVLLMVVAGYCVVRALDDARTGWLLGAGAALGGAFLAKTLEAFLVLPAVALVYLVAAPTPLRRRILQLLAAGVALVVSAGWWVAIVELWPAASRPFIGGSTTNSELQLIIGYNGLGRLTGNERTGGAGGFGGGAGGAGTARRFADAAREGGFGGGRGGGGFGGSTGIGRMFGEQMGTQISWLLPAALLGMLVLLWWTRRAPRTDRTRAAAILWGGWVLVSGIVFSFAKGTIHSYYTIVLAPAIAALVAVTAQQLWARRSTLAARVIAAVLLLVSASWAFVLLGRTSWHPALRPTVIVLGLLAAAFVLVSGVLGARRGAAARGRLLATGAAVVVLSLAASLTAPVAYALDTSATAHTGSSPSAGPGGTSFGGFGQQRAGGGGSSRAGGFGGEGTADPSLVALLKSDAGAHRWAAAISGSMAAAPLELASGQAVMAMGGFSGSDPTPTLAAFEKDVATGEIHYYLTSGSGGGFGGGGRGSSATITAWVTSHYTARTVGGDTVYDLTAPLG